MPRGSLFVLMLVPWLALFGILPASTRGGDPETVYPHKGFTSEEFGQGARSYWLFEPDQPKPDRAPVVVFHHGWLAVNPGLYGAWIEHLARSGLVVVFPRYQADWATRPVEFLPNAVEAVRAALDVLDGAPGRVRPDRERFALIGHSAGGNLSAQMAAVAAEEGLPSPRAVVCIFPGEVVAQQEPSFDRIPSKTLLVVAAAEQDVVVGDARARQIYAEATAVPPSRKKFVLYRSDRHTTPALVADHFAPSGMLTNLDTGEGPFRQIQVSRAGVDILDRYGFWRLADLTLSAAFAGLTLDEATDHGAAFRDLGRWGDGQPVTPPIAGDDLSAIPRVIPTYGARLIPWSPSAILRYLENRPRTGGLNSPPSGVVSRIAHPS